MTKYAFLARLEEALAALEPEERRETLQYYDEYFEDNPEAAETLSPEQIAAETLASYGIDSAPAKASDKPLSVGKLIGGIALAFLAFILGSVAFGMICAAAVLIVVGCMLLSFHTAVGITVFGAAVIVLGLFGLSLGGTIKSIGGAARLFKTCKGGADT